jgi:hypothetical protein
MSMQERDGNDRSDRRERHLERLERRRQRAAERILESENLTGDLEDQVAKPLLDWGVACAQQAAQETGEMEDEQADEAIAERLRATRHLIRSVSEWTQGMADMDDEANAAMLQQVSEKAAQAYGATDNPVDEERRQRFLQELPTLQNNPAQVVNGLRRLFQQE